MVRWYQLVSASMLPSHGHIKLGAMASFRLLSGGYQASESWANAICPSFTSYLHAPNLIEGGSAQGNEPEKLQLRESTAVHAGGVYRSLQLLLK